jgi:hypothetical protein
MVSLPLTTVQRLYKNTKTKSGFVPIIVLMASSRLPLLQFKPVISSEMHCYTTQTQLLMSF